MSRKRLSILIMMNRKPVFIQPALQMMRKLDALAAAYPEHYQVVEQTEVSKTYSCEKHLINLRKPRKVNEEHSQWARQRMQEMNRHKNAGNL